VANTQIKTTIRTKICGLTRSEDVASAVEAGVDALGFVFYEPSPRSVEVEQAKALIKSVPAFVTTVALFVDPSVELVEQVITECQIDLLQFHGDESPEFCQQFSRPYMKAVRVKNTEDIEKADEIYTNAKALLLDAYVENIPGGTGKTFDWSLVPEGLTKPWILAGGLSVENVKSSILQTQPYAVDVSGGVEAAKGIKSADKIQQFISEVRSAEQAIS